MTSKTNPIPEMSASEYATVKVTHHAQARERAEFVRGRKRSRQPECLVVGHAWTADAVREGGTICLVCDVVRWP